MNLFQKNVPTIIVLVAISLFSSACRAPQPPKPVLNHPAPRPINSIRVGNFQCDNEVTGQAVRNVFIEMLARYGDAKVVREGEADVAIEGTVTMVRGDSSSIRIDGDFGKGQRVAGDYVSGVTSLALRDGEVLTSASWGQEFGKGQTLLPPESVARQVADRLLSQLTREGLQRR